MACMWNRTSRCCWARLNALSVNDWKKGPRPGATRLKKTADWSGTPRAQEPIVPSPMSFWNVSGKPRIGRPPLELDLESWVLNPEDQCVQWKRVALIGVGLLGGSAGLALKKGRLARRVAGFVRRRASIAESEKARAVDFATVEIKHAVEGADLIILCTPLAQMRK